MNFDPQFALSVGPPVLRALGTTFLVTFGSSNWLRCLASRSSS
jgi:hypothetical protein